MTRRFRWTDASVRRALGLDEATADAADREFTGVSSDSRTLEPGNLFVALEGPRFDGHRFLDEAAKRGAGAAVVSRAPEGAPPLPLYPVVDTLIGLGQLARFRRRALEARVVALTGSSGKTTVRALLSAIFQVRHRVHATPGNLNNRVGLPLTLLECPDEAEVVVLEMGTNEPGEIGILTRIAEPDAALVTTVGAAHLEGLHSLEGVLAEKLALLTELKPGAPSLVGDEPPALPRRARELRDDVAVAGFSSRADDDRRGRVHSVDAEGRVPFTFRGRSVRPRLPGRHGAANGLLALAFGCLLKVPLEEAIPAVEAVAAPPLRGEVRKVGDVTLLLDCYNANPQSTRAALDWLGSVPSSGRRVAVLGSMLELGPAGPELHRDVLRYADALEVDLVVAVGEFAEAAATEPAGSGERMAVSSVDEAGEVLVARVEAGDVVLLKGSRGVALERLLPRLQEAFAGRASGAGEGAG